MTRYFLAVLLMSGMGWGQTHPSIMGGEHWTDARGCACSHNLDCTPDGLQCIDVHYTECDCTTLKHHSKPEPVDVPAIKEPRMSFGSRLMTGAPMLCSHHGTLSKYPDIGQCVDGWEWTCADKSRILLTDESGGKHCIRFPH
jgi:hypothetical protein